MASGEGPVSRYINRRISMPLARALVPTPLTPNQVSVAAFLMALAAMALLITGRNIEAGILIQASSIVDGVDGDLARAKGMASRFGGLFDATLDRLADAAIAGGMAVYALVHEDWPAPLVVGFAAAVACIVASYSRARLEAAAGQDAASELVGLASRDVRLLAFAAGAIAGQCWWALAIVAAVSYATVAWRLFRFRNAR